MGSTTDPKSGDVPADAVAIVGLAFRLPGDLRDADALWAALREGRDLVTEVPPERWAIDELRHPRRAEPGRSITFAAGVISGLEEFDAAFFGISPREAAALDPQQRLMLELAWEALEDAGQRPSALAGSDCSVHVGLSSLDNGMRGLDDLANMTAHAMTGNTLSLVANRISWFLDLRGPSLALDTACSSSLVALHQACALLRAGETPCALVGAVNLLLHPYSFVGFTKASMLSATGRCRAFDAAGDGYVRAEGGVMLFLKRARDALADGDPIHGLILASGVNTDGARKTGLTIPSVDAQAELLAGVLARARLAVDDIDFVEAHGTGTPVGDPVEAAALGRVYRARKQPLPIGSVKTNLGHLEPVSGLAGLLKAVLALKHGVLPPSLHFATPNPHIDFAALNLRVAVAPLPLASDRPLRAAVNSFGFGGANAHAILQAPVLPGVCSEARGVADALRIESPASEVAEPPALILSARSEAALRSLAHEYAMRLRDAPLEAGRATAAATWWRRDRLQHRLAVPLSGAADLLARHARGESPPRLVLEQALPDDDPHVAFVYSGNGAQWSGMGRRLWDECERFRTWFAEADAALRPHLAFVPIDELQAEPARLDDTAIAQPMLFAMQYAITGLLRDRGVAPHAVTGHSVGEIAAACAAGALDLAQAARVVCARSAAQATTRGAGRMAAAALPEIAARALLEELGGDLALAAVNSPGQVTLSGAPADLARVRERVERDGRFFRLLDLDYAFHSRHMDPIAAPLARDLDGLVPAAAQAARFVSSVSGAECVGNELDAAYWWRNVREPVRFDQAVATLAARGCRVFVEIGPHGILQRYLTECLAAGRVRVLATLRREDDGESRIEDTALRVHSLQSTPRQTHRVPMVALPAYPWQRERHWQAPTSESHRLAARRRVHSLLGWRLSELAAGWENTLDAMVLPWLADHRVGGSVLLPGTAYVELALAAAHEWHAGRHAACENLDIHAPMVFDEGQARLVRFELAPQDGRWTVSSRRRLSEDAWTLHASGRVIEMPDDAPEACIPDPGEGAECFDADTVRALAVRLGVEPGPAFGGLHEVRVGDGLLEARLELPEAVQDARYLLHPAAQDACFQAISALFRDEIGRGEADAMLPVRVAACECFARAPVASCRMRLLGRTRRSLLADFEFLDASGRLVGRARGCRFRAAPLRTRERDRTAIWHLAARRQPLPVEQCESALAPIDLAEVLRTELPDTPARRAWFGETLPLLEALVLSLLHQAVHAAGVVRRRADPLAPPSLRWALARLRDAGWLDDAASHESAEGHASCDFGIDVASHDAGDTNGEPSAPPPADTLLRTLWREAPACAATLAGLARAAAALPALWGGTPHRPEPSLLAQSGVMDDPARAATARALAAAVRAAHAGVAKGRRLSVLGIGDSVLHALPGGDDVDAVFASAGDFPPLPAGVVPATLDSAEWTLGGERELPAQFDLVLLSHAVHATARPQAVLAQARRWLAPGGVLLLAERHPDWCADLVGGLDAAWWHGDASGEPVSPLRSPEAWSGVLESLGFEAVQAIIEPAAQGFAAGAYLVLARRPCEPAELQATVPGTWLLLRDAVSSDIAQRLQTLLQHAGQHANLAEILDAHAAENIVDLRGWTDEADDLEHTSASTLATLRVLAAQPRPPRWWRVTRGGAPFGTAGSAHPGQGAAWALARVAANEFPTLRIVCIDVACAESENATPEDNDAVAQRLRDELLHPDGADEIQLTPQARHVPCLLQYEPPSRSTARFRLDFDMPGQLRNLTWRQDTPREPGEGEVEVRVHAAGLNFRDVMYALGLLPEEAVEGGFAGATLGLEFAGIVERIGAGVQGVAVGDAVLGFGGACFASHVVTRAQAVAPLPAGWTFEAAATVPVAFVTAWHALHGLARLQPGERVLIHGAAGGVGLAALQIAQHLGAEVIATAGTTEKRELLRRLGARHVFDSRSLAFADEVREATGGEGVDVVLNSLAGEAQRRSLALLRPFGRFLELGKRDFFADTPLGQRPFKDNLAFFGIDADRLLVARPAWAALAFEEVMARLRDGVFAPLPCRVFTAADATQAFRAMQQSRHLGKLVISMAQAPQVAPAPPATWRPESGECWLVTGGLAGFGLASARWLAARGVRHLLLLGRRGAQTPGGSEVLDEFAARGVQVLAEACDVADAAALQQAIENAAHVLPPLTGVLHAAMVIDDGLLVDLDATRLANVLRPKLRGAWNLHAATRGLPLRNFVLYSSVTTLFGSPGQGSYVAANGGLEALARRRRAEGLPATCVGWGPIADAGFLARNEALREGAARRLGAPPLQSGEALARLGEVLARGDTVCTVADFDWPVVSRMLPAAGTTRFAALEAARGEAAPDAPGGDLRERLLELPDEAAQALAVAQVREEVARILCLDAARIEVARPLHDAGMDSLMAVELAYALEQRFGTTFPVMALHDAPTVERIAACLLDALRRPPAAHDGIGEVVAQLARQHGESLAPDHAALLAGDARRRLHDDEAASA